MPLDEALGCLGLILRLVMGVLEVVCDTLNFADLLGHLGSWTVRLLTFGREKPDPESWSAIFYGLGVVAVTGLAVAF